MKIEYNITKYFENNNLFDDTISDGLKILKDENDNILITGSSVDLVNLADILVNVAMDKGENPHIHIDDLTLLDKNSDYKEIIIEKISN
ncbi:MAG: hypothetical protein VZS44_04775 [Bacilli bacterium]|nr:hypothetical protein [Bacilli bacterium]